MNSAIISQTNQDNSPIKLTGLSLSSTTINLGGRDQRIWTGVEFKENLSGFDYGWVSYYNEELDDRLSFYFDGDDDEATSTSAIGYSDINQYAAAGTYELQNIDLYDNAGNNLDIWSDDFGWENYLSNSGITNTTIKLQINNSDNSPVDNDGDGFVDEITNYQLWTSSGGVDLKNRRGKTFSDDTSRKWDAIKAVKDGGGFSILIEGHQNKDGNYKVASADNEGVISGASRWLNGNQMTNEGYEELFSMDFNGNNQIGF